jgi:menaquinone-dependent protoporphyrinogen oxidase
MSKILVVYGTSYGQTRRIAQRIAERLVSHGLSLTVRQGDELTGREPLDEYDGFVVGASVIGGKHQPYIGAFIRRNATRLNSVPSAFFSVSGSAASPLSEKRAAVKKLVEEFLTATSWRPVQVATFGGMMAYTQYGFILRWFTKLVAMRSGGPTDTSRDHDFTDWAEVDRFAEKLVAVFAPASRGAG